MSDNVEQRTETDIHTYINILTLLKFKNWMESIRKAMNERKLNEGQ